MTASTLLHACFHPASSLLHPCFIPASAGLAPDRSAQLVATIIINRAHRLRHGLVPAVPAIGFVRKKVSVRTPFTERSLNPNS